MLKMLSLSSEKTVATLLALLATAAVVLAQASSYSCILYTIEQPRIPRSLIKEE